MLPLIMPNFKKSPSAWKFILLKIRYLFFVFSAIAMLVNCHSQSDNVTREVELHLSLLDAARKSLKTEGIIIIDNRDEVREYLNKRTIEALSVKNLDIIANELNPILEEIKLIDKQLALLQCMVVSLNYSSYLEKIKSQEVTRREMQLMKTWLQKQENKIILIELDNNLIKTLQENLQPILKMLDSSEVKKPSEKIMKYLRVFRDAYSGKILKKHGFQFDEIISYPGTALAVSELKIKDFEMAEKFINFLNSYRPPLIHFHINRSSYQPQEDFLGKLMMMNSLKIDEIIEWNLKHNTACR